MAGKSVYIRQVAIIILLAQIGSYVPAQAASLSLVDRIFVRSGASDMITAGMSTFMVEMAETAHILNHATEKSLIIMDEIGKGTSTFDGISLAWATAEYLVTETKAKTLFATHYHELQQLEDYLPDHVSNYHMAVNHEHEKPVFLYTLIPGGSSHSHGIAVAKLAGIPHKVIKSAEEMLKKMESKGNTTEFKKKIDDNNLDSDTNKSFYYDSNRFSTDFIEYINSIEIHNLTPLDGLNKLAKIKSMIQSDLGKS